MEDNQVKCADYFHLASYCMGEDDQESNYKQLNITICKSE